MWPWHGTRARQRLPVTLARQSGRGGSGRPARRAHTGTAGVSGYPAAQARPPRPDAGQEGDPTPHTARSGPVPARSGPFSNPFRCMEGLRYARLRAGGSATRRGETARRTRCHFRCLGENGPHLDAFPRYTKPLTPLRVLVVSGVATDIPIYARPRAGHGGSLEPLRRSRRKTRTVTFSPCPQRPSPLSAPRNHALRCPAEEQGVERKPLPSTRRLARTATISPSLVFRICPPGTGAAESEM